MAETRDSKQQKTKSKSKKTERLIYVWGSNNNGQLGLGNNEDPLNDNNPTSLSEIVKNQPPLQKWSCITQPTLMLNFPKNDEILLDFSCGENHSLFKT